MEYILVSACLLGEPVRYNGIDKRCDHAVLQRWIGEGRVVPVCPEIAAGLPVPRPPAEIAHGISGLHVLSGNARVLESTGGDVTRQFVEGAGLALELARSKRIRVAVLKEGSPSCGSSFTYDGTFSGTRVPYPGVTAARLQHAGIHVFNEVQLEEADRLIQQFEAENTAVPVKY